jgi:signal transduction histidine kinase
VQVSLSEANEKAIIIIADNGVGIPANEKQKIFDKFYRIGNEQTRSAKGTGLGLYIVKHLVEKHGGTITVKDNASNGTLFELVFPTQKKLTDE